MATPQPAERAIEVALASIAWRREGWAIMVVNVAGDVSTFTGYTHDQAWKLLQRTALLTTTSVWIKDRIVPVVDATKAPPIPKPALIRPSISVNLRFEVLTRDDFTCRYCGRSAPDVVLHVDHVVSRKDGGTDELTNLVTACQDCNLGKGAKSSDLP